MPLCDVYFIPININIPPKQKHQYFLDQFSQVPKIVQLWLWSSVTHPTSVRRDILLLGRWCGLVGMVHFFFFISLLGFKHQYILRISIFWKCVQVYWCSKLNINMPNIFQPYPCFKFHLEVCNVWKFGFHLEKLIIYKRSGTQLVFETPYLSNLLSVSFI